MKLELANVPMACRGARRRGRARCRNMVRDGRRLCETHDVEPSSLAPGPDVILLKCKVNQKWAGRLEEAGVRWQGRDDKALDARHEARAQRVRRSPTALRAKPDSGAPVFGRRGALRTSVEELFTELTGIAADGVGRGRFIPVDVHLYRRVQDRNHMSNLCLVLRAEAEESGQTDLGRCHEVLHELFTVTWEIAHVWANDPEDDGRIVHTINLVHRMPDDTPEYRLVYDDGLWGLVKASE